MGLSLSVRQNESLWGAPPHCAIIHLVVYGCPYLAPPRENPGYATGYSYYFYLPFITLKFTLH